MCVKRKELQDFNSLYDLLDYFSSEEICEEYLVSIRWDGEPKCPHCDSKRVGVLQGKTKRYKCYGCRKQFGVKVGTIFHDSKIPLRKWFMAIYLIASTKKGMSSHQLARDLKIHQESAWFVLQRIRETYVPSKRKFTKRTVEVDETYYGGKEKNKHKDKKTPNTQGRSTKTKSAIFGVLERDGKVYAVPVKDTTGKTILPIVESVVAKNSKVYTDEYRPYRSLRKKFRHDYVKHNQGEYARGKVHTNGIEGFWSQLKRGVSGTYHSVSKKHLERYVNEATFRYNNRQLSGGERFNIVLSKSNVKLDFDTLVNGKTKTGEERRVETGKGCKNS